MRVLIVYQSLYGTNQRIAEAIADGIGDDAIVTIVEAQSAPSALDADLDLLRRSGARLVAKPHKNDSADGVGAVPRTLVAGKGTA